MKKVFLFFLSALFSINVCAQQNIVRAGFDLSNYGVRIEPDKRLMTVMAALETARTKDAAGADTALIKTPLSEQGTKFREQLQTDLPNVPADLRQKITSFVEQYKRRHPKATDAQIIQPFISMAYSLTPAPELADPIITNDLPGELLDVLDFAPLVREFYRRSGFSQKLADYVKIYQTASDSQLRESSKQMVGALLDYLHTRPQTTILEKIKTQTTRAGKKKPTLEKITTREHERRFYIVPELLMPAENVVSINVGDDYYVIAPTDADLSLTEARRAFLQFVIDPLVLTNAKDVSAFNPMIKSLLDEQRKANPDVSPDVYLAVSRSLVAAVDARENAYRSYKYAIQDFRNSGGKPLSVNEREKTSKLTDELFVINGKYVLPRIDDEIALRLSEDYKKGAVLDFYFADQLKGLEDSGFDIAASLKDMILSLGTAKEDTRLAQFAEAAKRGAANRKAANDQPIKITNPVTARLLEIEKTIQAKNYSQANIELRQLSAKYPTEPRIYYNLGRVAAISAENSTEDDARNAKLKEAQAAYSQAIKTANPQTDPALISLTYVALAKIYEFYDQNAYAIKIYEAAIKVGDVSGGAFKEAIAGREKLLKNQ